MNFKDIHIGNLLKEKYTERGISIDRISNFLNCSTMDIEQMFLSEEISTTMLLKWSKILEYDFFRIYSQHLILYSPPSAQNLSEKTKKSKILPTFRKSIYTQEVIDFILEQILTGKKTKNQVIEEYKIPKTTLYKWISKYSK